MQNQCYIIFTLNKAATSIQDNFTLTKLLYQKKPKKQDSIRVEHRQKRTSDNLFPGHAIYHLQVLHIISLIFPLLVQDKF